MTIIKVITKETTRTKITETTAMQPVNDKCYGESEVIMVFRHVC